MGPIIAAALTTPQTRTISVFVGNRDVTADVKYDALRVTDSGTNAKGTADLRVELTPSSVPEITDQALVRVEDHTDGGEVFRGFVRARRPSQIPTYAYLDIIADDITSLLDDAVIDVEYRPPESAQARLGYLWGKYAGHFLSGDFSFVQAVGSTLPAQRFALVSLRNAIEMTLAQADATAAYYVDMLGKLHVFTSETNDAPFNIDADSPGGGEIAPHDLDLEHDSNTYANRVFISGASPEASGYFQDDAAIAAANGLVRTTTVQAPDCTTAVMAEALARTYLERSKAAVPRGSFSATSPDDGWRAGQNIEVTSAAHGLTAAPYRIARVTTSIIKPGSDLKRRYQVEFGGARAGTGIDGVSPLIAGSTAGIYMLDQLGNAIVSNAAAANSGGLGPAVRRYIMSGVYNGDFYAPPPGPDAPIDNTNNPLPYWSFVEASGTSTRALSVLDDTNASGRKILFQMEAGAAGDEAYVEQIIPINGSQAFAYTYSIGATFKTTGAVNNMRATIEAQYLKNDGVTTTGPSASNFATTTSKGANTVFDISASPGVPDLTPADAYFLRVRAGFVRATEANGSSGEVELHELHLSSGTLELRVAEGTDPATYGPSTLSSINGALVIGANQGGSSGTSPSIALDGSPGNIVLQAADTVWSIVGNDFTVDATDDVLLNAGDDVLVDAGGDIGLDAGGDIDLEAGGLIDMAPVAVTQVRQTFQGVIAARNSTQAITTGTWTAIDFNGVEVTDPFGFHDPSSNPSRFTIPTGWEGTYLLIGNVQIESTGTRVIGGWDVNGSGTPGNNTLTVSPGGVTATDRQFMAVAMIELDAGDYVEFMVQHSHGSNRNYLSNGIAMVFRMGNRN
jgi:hypothetical protein